MNQIDSVWIHIYEKLTISLLFLQSSNPFDPQCYKIYAHGVMALLHPSIDGPYMHSFMFRKM